VGERISTASFEAGSRTSRASLKRESFSSVHAKLRAGTKDCGCGAGWRDKFVSRIWRCNSSASASLPNVPQSPPDALAESDRPGGHKAIDAPCVRLGYKDIFEEQRQASPRSSHILRQWRLRGNNNTSNKDDHKTALLRQATSSGHEGTMR
jgi:hypothetical protein